MPLIHLINLVKLNIITENSELLFGFVAKTLCLHFTTFA